MQADFVFLTNLVKDTQRSAAVEHEVLGNHLDKIHRHLLLKKLLIMR